MKLNNLKFQPDYLVDLQKGKQKNFETSKMNPPKWSREDVAFNFINKDFRKNRHTVRKMNKNIHDNRWTSNGGHGIYRHDITNLVKVAGKEKLIREKLINEDTNLNEIAVQEYMQLNFKGTELKGKRITNKKEAIDYIKSTSKKYNRGGNAGGRRTGLYSAGRRMREYEKIQLKLSAEDFNQAEEDDEFESLQSKIEKQETDSNIKIGHDGL